MRITSLLTIALLATSSIYAQTDEPTEGGSLNSGTLEQQFNYMLSNSNRYQEFKVIKKTWLNTYWSHVADTLDQLHTEIDAYETQIARQSNTISDLESRLSETNASLSSVNEEKDNITFLGAETEKGLYKKIMWGIVFGLLAILLLTLVRFRSSKSVTKSTKARLAEIEADFDGHKKRALEKEQELKRELQDYINRLDTSGPPL